VNKIIFLDIDGVLNVIPQGRDKYGAIFHKHFVENLEQIIDETDAKIVISSSWRHDGLQAMKDMWRDRNLPGEVIDITKFTASEYIVELYSDLPKGTERGYEIQEWIHVNKPDKYVILDDDKDMLTCQMGNFVQTYKNMTHTGYVDLGYGLTKECAQRAIDILNS
jgi:hypothetical protein